MRKLPIPLIVLIGAVLFIVLFGPILGLVHYVSVRFDPRVVWLGGGGAILLVLSFVVFPHHLKSLFSSTTRQLKRVIDDNDEDTAHYYQLPEGRHQQDTSVNHLYWIEQQAFEPAAQWQEPTPEPTTTGLLASEETIQIATDCLLPLSSALTHSIVFERPGERGRSIASRLYIERFGAYPLPQLIVTRNPSAATLLPFLPNGWIAGSPDAQERYLPVLATYKSQVPGIEFHYGQVTTSNAEAFGMHLVKAEAQVIFDLSTYKSYDQAAQVLILLLQGIKDVQQACIIHMEEANKWMPNDTWFEHGYGFIQSQNLADHLRNVFAEIMKTQKDTVYLSAEHLMPLDARLLMLCELWTLNTNPSHEDSTYIVSPRTGLPEQEVAQLDSRNGRPGIGAGSFLADVITQTKMKIILHRHQSAYEPLESDQVRTTSALSAIDLRAIGMSPAASADGEVGLGKTLAERGNEEETVESAGLLSATRPKEFSRAQLIYAVALQRAGEEHFTPTALRRPPKTKLVQQGLSITFAELAHELGVREDVLDSTQARHLQDAVVTLSSEEQSEYKEEIAFLLNTIQDRSSALAPTESSHPLLLARQASNWELPPLTLFQAARVEEQISKQEVRKREHIIRQTLKGHGVRAEVREEYTSIGARVLAFGILPTGIPLEKDGQVVHDQFGDIEYSKKTKIADITKYREDLQAALGATKLRMLNPMPGEPYVGVEIPNPRPTTVVIREVLEDPKFQRAHLRSGLVVAVGRDLAGNVVYLDLESTTPHALIAGTTGGGKSVLENVLIASLLTYYSPDDVQLLLIDPKKVEFSMYNGIPHLLSPVVTEAKEAAAALLHVQDEMKQRYELFSKLGVRNIKEYRKLRQKQISEGNWSLPLIPSIVAIIDEFAALMEMAKQIEEELEKSPESIVDQIAALGRAAGIHLVVATQYPIAEVVTSTIKANLSAKIAFVMPSRTNSQVVLDQPGAETLEGRGDAIYKSPDHPSLRTQGAFMTDDENAALIAYWQQARPLQPDEQRAFKPLSSLSQLPLLDLPTASQVPFAEDGREKEEKLGAEGTKEDEATDEMSNAQQEDESIAAFLRGDPLPLSLRNLPGNEAAKKLYPYAKAWTKQQETVTRDQLRVIFGVGQGTAGTLLVLLEQQGIIGPRQDGGRPRQVLVFQPSTSDTASIVEAVSLSDV